MLISSLQAFSFLFLSRFFLVSFFLCSGLVSAGTFSLTSSTNVCTSLSVGASPEATSREVNSPSVADVHLAPEVGDVGHYERDDERHNAHAGQSELAGRVYVPADLEICRNIDILSFIRGSSKPTYCRCLCAPKHSMV